MIFRICVFTLCLIIPLFSSSSYQGDEDVRSYFVPSKHHVLQYFLDVIYENSFCRCQGNNGCTRGCRFEDHLERGEYAPIRRCTGRKPMGKSNDICARHVNGAIMSVIHNFLYFHCDDIGAGVPENMEDYQMCVDRFSEDIRNNNVNICRQSFIFPAALCMLNLDGKSFDLYNSIATRGIRRTCKNWDRYNQMLVNIEVSTYYRQTAMLPMFKRIPSERYKEFRADPDKIPVGAIVVTNSFINPEGHVEVKIDRNECGRNKDQACFCSDFCRERSTYRSKVLAVFEWNPDLIGYLWNTFL